MLMNCGVAHSDHLYEGVMLLLDSGAKCCVCPRSYAPECPTEPLPVETTPSLVTAAGDPMHVYGTECAHYPSYPVVSVDGLGRYVFGISLDSRRTMLTRRGHSRADVTTMALLLGPESRRRPRSAPPHKYMVAPITSSSSATISFEGVYPGDEYYGDFQQSIGLQYLVHPDRGYNKIQKAGPAPSTQGHELRRRRELEALCVFSYYVIQALLG